MDLLNLKHEDYLDLYETVVNPRRVDFHVKLKPKQIECPECGSCSIIIKEWKTRKIKHSVYDGKETYIFVKFARYKCKDCGITFSETNPIGLKRQRISLQIIKKIIEELADWNATYQKVADRVGVSNSTVLNVVDHYLYFDPKPLPKALCIDEIYVTPEEAQPYACVLLNHKDGTLIDVIKGRSKPHLKNYFLSKSESDREKVVFVNIDMWEPYLDVAKRCFPNAVIAIDSFHVMEHFVKAIHDIRCRVIKDFDDHSNQAYILKSVRKLLTISRSLNYEKVWNHKLKSYLSEVDMVQAALDVSEDLNIAYHFYHRYRLFNKNSCYEKAEESFDSIISNCEKENKVDELQPIISMLQNWRPWIINSFIVCDEKRLSNGPIESVNARLKKIKKTMGKVDNFERYRLRCMLSINKNISFHYQKINTIKRKGKLRGKYNKKESIKADF